MTSGTEQNTFIHPTVKEFTTNLGLLLSREDVVEVFKTGTPEQKIEQILIASDDLLQPTGNHILLNADMTLKELLQGD